MNYQAITKCDIANGEGVRVTVWVSGCAMNCRECHSLQTWDYKSGTPFTGETMEEVLDACAPDYIQGLTFSGGHPLDPQNHPVVKEIAKQFKKRYPNKDVWVYTGYVLTKDSIQSPEFDYYDIVVDGPFIPEERDPSLAFRGSRNQRIIDINESRKQQKIIVYKK